MKNLRSLVFLAAFFIVMLSALIYGAEHLPLGFVVFIAAFYTAYELNKILAVYVMAEMVGITFEKARAFLMALESGEGDSGEVSETATE